LIEERERLPRPDGIFLGTLGRCAISVREELEFLSKPREL
jgi:hypothetical protein